ncbi:MAG: hypothetical protein Q7S18_03260 [bacterium]|nr:hypothetical protein [bacterium]
MITEEKLPAKGWSAFGGKKIKIAALIVGLVIIILGSFSTGVFVGLMKARFSSKFGENYERNFTGSRMGEGRSGFMREFSGRDFRNAHGISGTIVSISDNNLIIKDRDEKENTVSVNDKTIIKNGRDTIKIGDLKTDERIVILGKPGDSGTVNADLIRVFDANANVGR